MNKNAFLLEGTCVRFNALDPDHAYKIIGQIEGTLPSSGSTFLDLIKSPKTGVNYTKEFPTIVVRFQPNVVGQLDEISLPGHKNNIREFQVDLFDCYNNLIFSKQTIYPEEIR